MAGSRSFFFFFMYVGCYFQCAALNSWQDFHNIGACRCCTYVLVKKKQKKKQYNPVSLYGFQYSFQFPIIHLFILTYIV